MPERILGAYVDFHEALFIRNSLAGTLGEPYKRRCSIPQGCPFSMMIIALLMRPWTLKVEKEGCKPRILADDMALSASGPGHTKRFHAGYTKTIEYLGDMGAIIAKDKCFLFSTSKEARTWLENVEWPTFDGPIKVVIDVRDLGAHLNTGMRPNGSTQTKRLTETTTTVRQIGRLPHDYEDKHTFIKVKALAKGL